MRKNRYIGVLDIGETFVRCGIGEYNSEENIIITRAVVAEPNNSILKGSIRDIEKLSKLIKNAINKAEKIAEVDISSVFVSVSGNFISVIKSTQNVDVIDPKSGVSSIDVKNILTTSKKSQIPYEKEVIELVVNQYKLDAMDHIQNPLGLIGTKLYIDYMLVIGDKNILDNYKKIMQDYVKVNVEKFVLSTVALSNSILSEDKKESGVLLIDMGHHNTSVSLFHKGSVVFLKYFPIGGYYFINDFMKVLEIRKDEAIRVLEQFNELYQAEFNITEIEYVSVNGKRHKRKIENLADILTARAEQLFEEFIYKELNAERIFDREDISIDSGIILSGGAARIKILPKILNNIFNLPVTIGTSNEVSKYRQESNNPAYNQIFGLMKFVLNEQKKSKDIKELEDNDKLDDESFGIKAIFNKLVKLVQEYL